MQGFSLLNFIISFKFKPMGYVFDFNDAQAYEQSLQTAANRTIADLENRLLIELLKPLAGKRVLDIGCGAGASLAPLLEAGLQATALDPSPYMLDIAKKKLGNRVDFHRGVAEDLPFDDNSFNYACLVTTLEFVEDPQKALQEACRVATDRIFLGVMNRYAVKGVQLRLKGIFTKSIYNRARFFSIWELKQMIRSFLSDVPVSWRTVCQLQNVTGMFSRRIERLSFLQHCPFGTFAGMVVTLVPRFRTKPLSVPYGSKRSASEITT